MKAKIDPSNFQCMQGIAFRRAPHLVKTGAAFCYDIPSSCAFDISPRVTYNLVSDVKANSDITWSDDGRLSASLELVVKLVK